MEINLQRINVKLMTAEVNDLDIDPFIGVFGRWRHDKTHHSRWIDLADYAHIPRGQGVVLVGKQGNFSIDLTDPGPGMLYCGKNDFEGPVATRVLEAMKRCLSLSLSLILEPEYPQKLLLRPGYWIVTVNDRLNFPNTAETEDKLGVSIRRAFENLFGSDNYLATREPDPNRRYGYSVTVAGLPDAKEILEKITQLTV